MPSDAHPPRPDRLSTHSYRLNWYASASILASTLVLAAVTLTGCGTNISTEVTSTTGTLSASTDTLDLGSSVIGSTSATTSVAFTNNGKKDVALSTSAPGGTEFQTVSSTCGGTLAAGKSCTIGVNFTPAAAGLRTSTLTLTTSTQNTKITLHGIGLRPAAVAMSNATLAFPDTLLGTASAVQQVTYTNSGDVASPVVLKLQGSFQQSASTCTQAIAPQASCYVSLAFLPTTRGVNTGSLTASIGSTSTSTALSGNGLAPAHVAVSPAAIEFADTAVQSTSASTAVTLTNDGDMDSPLTQGAIAKDFAFSSSTCAKTLPAHAQCAVQLAFQPTSSGYKTGTATLVAGASTLTIPMSGTGYVPSQLTVTPTSVSFANTLAGSTSAASRIVVANSGDRAAKVQIAAAPQGFQYGPTDCAASLAGHAQCSIAVSFAPVSSGSKTGNLSIATDTGTVTATFTGTAQAPAHVQVSPTSVSFPDVLSGQSSAPMPFVFTNTGDVAATLGTLQLSNGFVLAANGCGSTLAAHASCTASVVFQPGTSGSETGTLTVQAGTDTVQSVLAGNATSPTQVPVLQATVPAAVTAGTSTTVHVTGTGLGTIDTMFLDGVATAFNRVSATEVTFNANPPQWAMQPISVIVHAPGTGGGNSNAVPLQVTVAPVSYDAAVRFTQQAAMTTTADQVAQVQARGFSKWVDWQLTTPIYPYVTRTDAAYGGYFSNAQNSSYALRQRVTLALKQVFTYGFSGNCYVTECGKFWEASLQKDAFGNVRTLLYDVATSPMMGSFLQNAGNYTYAPWTGASRANANFAREFMQLMSIGPYNLNRDGSRVLDSNGQTIAPYTEDNVNAMAAAMSGWVYADIGIYDSLLTGNPLLPMKVTDSLHNPLSKAILPGVTLPAGQGGAKDMSDVVDALFQHPNIAPFLCRRLIQHLVTSNPSPAYITRIVSVFEDNGAGVRGDLGAIVKAILLDPEARRGDDPNGSYTQTDTHYMEPLLFIAQSVTAIGAGFTDDQTMNVTNALGQDPYVSKTVFGAYSPDNRIPAGVYAPEVQLMNDTSSLQKVAFVNSVARGLQPGVIGDVSGSVFWNAASPTALLDQMNHFLFHGTMPAALRAALTTYVADHAGSTTNQMLPDLLVIALNSSAYQVLH